MTTKTEALTKALVALAKVDALCPVESNAEIYVRDALDAIKEALAQPEQETDWEGIAADQAMTIALMKSEQEPVAHIGMIDEEHFADVCRKAKGNSNTPLYTSPPARKWVGLTDDALFEIVRSEGKVTKADAWEIVENLQAKLKEKNT